jgi:cell division septation protein DedD
MLLDTTLTDSEREYWLSIQESDLPQPDFTSAFPYRGAYWDSTRAILGKIEDQYASATPMISRVRALNRELQFPEEVESPILSDDPIAEASPSERTEETVQPEVTRIPPIERETEREETPPPAPPIITESEEAPPPVTAEREEVAPPAPPVTIEREEITPPAPPVTAEREEIPTPVPPVTAEREFVESYTIVLYSFSNEQAARSTADELITYGDTIFICPRVIDDSTFFRVSVGSFEEIVPAIQKSRILEEPYRTNNFISSTNSACEITFLSE